MIQPKSFILFLLSILFISISFAQKSNKKNSSVSRAETKLIYDNIIYNSSIKTVMVHPTERESQFPILSLSKSYILQITFDDLRADSRSLYFQVEHCNADCSPSRLPTMDYLEGYTEDRISDMKPSENTRIPYTHYRFNFPNDNTQLKKAGNYLLKVYENANPSELLFTQRFYVVEDLATIDAELVPSSQSNKRLRNQKLNLAINTNFEIANPRFSLQIHALQNHRTDNFQILREPSQISSQKIAYHLPQTLDFEGNNEFRTVDLRSVRNVSSQVRELNRDSSISAILEADRNISKENYIWKPDENGRFYIRNMDFAEQTTQSEYIYTLFSLKDSSNIDGDIYLVGGFNNYVRTALNKLTYNTEQKTWETVQLLKQGVYDYEYVLESADKTQISKFSGSYFDTENEYQILLYYRKPGTYWDEIIGFKQITK